MLFKYTYTSVFHICTWNTTDVVIFTRSIDNTRHIRWTAAFAKKALRTLIIYDIRELRTLQGNYALLSIRRSIQECVHNTLLTENQI